MGTNYYIELPHCLSYTESDERYHVGKSSAGWCFALHVDPDKGINDLEDIKALCKQGRIKNEYDETLALN
jgi:hypothetical protein